MARKRLIREEPLLPDSAFLVRMIFGNNTPDTAFTYPELVADATNNFELFGYFGLSLWASENGTSLDELLSTKCVNSEHLALFTAADIRDKGLGLVPSGRFPHYDASVGEVYGSRYGAVQIVASSADDLIKRFLTIPHIIVQNAYYETDLP